MNTIIGLIQIKINLDWTQIGHHVKRVLSSCLLEYAHFPDCRSHTEHVSHYDTYAFPPLILPNTPTNARQPYNFLLYFDVKSTCLCHTCFPTVTLCEYFNNVATGSKSGQLWRGLSKAVCVACLLHLIVCIVSFDLQVLIMYLKREIYPRAGH